MSSVNATGINTSILSEGSISPSTATTVVKTEEQAKPQKKLSADKVTISEDARLLLDSDMVEKTDDTGIEPPDAAPLDTGIEPPKAAARDTGIEPPK